jgi:hypothetical protein
MIRSYRFRNPGETEMVVWVDLWSTDILVPPGSVLTIHTHHENDDGAPTIQPTERGLAFWAECDGWEADLDGEPLSPEVI